MLHDKESPQTSQRSCRSPAWIHIDQTTGRRAAGNAITFLFPPILYFLHDY